jgi:hypothetical protein
VAGLLLAMIDLPDFGTPLRSIADSVEKIADASPAETSEPVQPVAPVTDISVAQQKEHGHV